MNSSGSMKKTISVSLKIIRLLFIGVSVGIFPYQLVLFAQPAAPETGYDRTGQSATFNQEKERPPENKEQMGLEKKIAAFQPDTVSLSDAIQMALEANPNIHIAKGTVQQREGELQSATGQFEAVPFAGLTAEREKQPLTDAAEAYARAVGKDEFALTETTSFSLGVTKQFRSGVQFIPSASVSSIEDNTSQTEPLTGSDVKAEIIIPLLRGLGTNPADTLEKTARYNLSASELSTQHTIAGLIFFTTQTFWNCLSAKLSYDLVTDTQQRSDMLLRLVERLIAAGLLEPGALNSAKAQTFSSQVEAREAAVNLYRSQQALAVAMGYKAEKLIKAPVPDSDFPKVVDLEQIKADLAKGYINRALKSRGDYLAAQVNIQNAEGQLYQARNDLKPRLDLNLALGYSGLNERTGSERYYRTDKWEGLNSLVGFSLELPVTNDLARGNILKRKALVREAELISDDLANNITSEVLIAMETLRSTIYEYEMAERSESAYKKAVEFENQKYKAGTSTWSALIDAEDRYFRARTSKIVAFRKYAVALAEFRFVTGTLLEIKEKEIRFKLQNLVELPPLAEK